MQIYGSFPRSGYDKVDCIIYRNHPDICVDVEQGITKNATQKSCQNSRRALNKNLIRSFHNMIIELFIINLQSLHIARFRWHEGANDDWRTNNSHR